MESIDDESLLQLRANDNTLPRTKDFICPNKKCDSKNVNDKSREAIFYRPDSNKYNLKYKDEKQTFNERENMNHYRLFLNSSIYAKIVPF